MFQWTTSINFIVCIGILEGAEQKTVDFVSSFSLPVNCSYFVHLGCFKLYIQYLITKDFVLGPSAIGV